MDDTLVRVTADDTTVVVYDAALVRALIAGIGTPTTGTTTTGTTTTGTTTTSGGPASVNVNTRTILAAAPTDVPAYLSEPGREGVFVFDSSNLSAKVTADTQQGIYVAPSSATTGASGAWVRKFSGPFDIRWFGGVADSTALVGSAYNGTDNTAALAGAISVGSALTRSTVIYFPQGAAAYRFASRTILTAGISIIGDGWHYNPGLVGATTYSGITYNYGTVLCFDTNVGGFQFIPYTDNLANAAAYEYQSSLGSQVENLMMLGGGGTSLTAHAIDSRTIIHCRNLYISGFAGTGVRNEAWDSGAVLYGSTDGATFFYVVSRANKLHGFHNVGNDANVMNFIGCDGSLNGGVGFLEAAGLGNTYTGCHAATNNQSHPSNAYAANHTAGQRTQCTTDWSGLSDAYAGSYVTTSAVGGHVFTGCYSEGGQGLKHEIISPSIIVGGNVSSASGVKTVAATASQLGSANILNGSTGLTNVYASSGTSQLTVETAGAGYVNIQLKSNGGMANGLDVLAGLQSSYFSCDNFNFRNAAQATNFATLGVSGYDLKSGAYKANGTQVVGARQTGTPADATDLATALTLVNSLKAKLVTHGLIS